MRMTASFHSDLNLFDQLLTVQLLPPSRLAVAAPCCSRLQCFSSSFCFFFFVFPAEVMAAAPSAAQTTPLSPPTVYCHFCNLPDTLKKKRKKKKSSLPSSQQRPVCWAPCFSPCVWLESFLPPQGGRHASRS